MSDTMHRYRQFGRFLAACLLVSLSAGSGTAQPVELTQSQLRQLVAQEQILAADVSAGSAAKSANGIVMDMRGFLHDGRMTYRVLLQRSDGAIVEVMMNGQSGQQISHSSERGRVVSEAARSESLKSTADADLQRASADAPARSSNAKSSRDNESNNRGNTAARGNGRS